MKMFLRTLFFFLIAVNQMCHAELMGCFSAEDETNTTQTANASVCGPESLQDQPGDDELTKNVRHIILTSANFLHDPTQWGEYKWATNIQVCIIPNTDNAYADSLSSRIILGLPLLDELYHTGLGYSTAAGMQAEYAKHAALAVYYHEFAHHIQFNLMQQIYPVYYENRTNTVNILKVELEADAIAGALLQLDQQPPAEGIYAITAAYSHLGSSDFKNPKFHGFPQVRQWAANQGIKALGNSEQLTIEILKNIHETVFVKGRPGLLAPTPVSIKTAKILTVNHITDLQAQISDSQSPWLSTAALHKFSDLGFGTDVVRSAQNPRVALLNTALHSGHSSHALSNADFEINSAWELTQAGSTAAGFDSSQVSNHLANAMYWIQDIEPVEISVEPALKPVLDPVKIAIGHNGISHSLRAGRVCLWIRGVSDDGLACTVTSSDRGPDKDVLQEWTLKKDSTAQAEYRGETYQFCLDGLSSQKDWAIISASKTVVPNQQIFEHKLSEFLKPNLISGGN